MEIFWGILIPFFGTTAGAACVYFMKDKINNYVLKLLLGFASGVMVAASVWSLLIPAMEMSASMGKLSFLPAAIGFMLGILFLLFLDHMIPHMHLDNKAEGPKSHLKKTTMLMILDETLHAKYAQNSINQYSKVKLRQDADLDKLIDFILE